MDTVLEKKHFFFFSFKGKTFLVCFRKLIGIAGPNWLLRDTGITVLFNAILLASKITNFILQMDKKY